MTQTEGEGRKRVLTIKGVEMGPNGEAVVTLSDGSLLGGLTSIDATLPSIGDLGRFDISGYFMAGMSERTPTETTLTRVKVDG